jgi:hypothetical protein
MRQTLDKKGVRYGKIGVKLMATPFRLPAVAESFQAGKLEGMAVNSNEELKRGLLDLCYVANQLMAYG